MSAVLDCLVAPASPPGVPLVDQRPAVVHLHLCVPTVSLRVVPPVLRPAAAALHVRRCVFCNHLSCVRLQHAPQCCLTAQCLFDFDFDFDQALK